MNEWIIIMCKMMVIVFHVLGVGVDVGVNEPLFCIKWRIVFQVLGVGVDVGVSEPLFCIKWRIVFQVLVIGGGDGGVIREVLKYKSVTNVVLCEIDQVKLPLGFQIHLLT